MTQLKFDRFAKFAWFALGYNILVILWGVFLRASKSGDGCGQHWLTCHGEVIPSAPQMKTVIEFSHRITSAIAFFVVLALLIWAFRKFEKGSAVRKTAVVSFIFIITEALVGAGLVLTGNTAENLTSARPFWMFGHLVNTFILLAFLTLTAWFASGGKRFNFRVETIYLLVIGLAIIGILFVGMSGSLAALSSMIFPSESLSEGIAKDFSDSSHILLRLRISHPILSVLVGIYLIFAATFLKTKSGNAPNVTRWSGILSLIVILQIMSGALTILTGSPILMQILHLLLADALWISFVLMTANFLAEKNSTFDLNQIVGEPV